jgi:putative redox protein
MASTPRASRAYDSGHGGLQVLISAGPARFVADEPLALGGLDLGPTPHELVGAGLAACTVQTLRLYAKRKGWALGAMRVTVTHDRDIGLTPPDVFTRTLWLDGQLDADQRARLLEIAELCPVHKLLTGGAAVKTAVALEDLPAPDGD